MFFLIPFAGAVPVVLTQPLCFCDNVVGLSCCDPAADAMLREEFEAINVPASDAACAETTVAPRAEASAARGERRRPHGGAERESRRGHQAA